MSSNPPVPLSLPKRSFRGRMPEPLVDLFAALDAFVAPIPVAELHRRLRDLRLEPADLAEAIASDATSYVRTLMHTGPTYEALIMCWLPGQRSPIHDHAGSACAVRVISGSAIETRYSLDADRLAIPTGQSIFASGSVTCSADADIHTLANALPGLACGEPLITLHIYSPVLIASRKYEPRLRKATVSE